MKKEYQKIPILEYEGKNLEEKESRHDLDSRLSEDKGTRNHDNSDHGNTLG